MSIFSKKIKEECLVCKRTKDEQVKRMEVLTEMEIGFLKKELKDLHDEVEKSKKEFETYLLKSTLEEAQARGWKIIINPKSSAGRD